MKVLIALVLIFFINESSAQTVNPPAEALVNKDTYYTWLKQQSSATLFKLASENNIGTCRVIDSSRCDTCDYPYYVVNKNESWSGWNAPGAGASTRGMPGNNDVGSIGGAPACIEASGYTAEMCDGTTESRIGAQVKAAINTDVMGDGDPCRLDEFLKTIALSQSIDLRAMVEQGKIGFSTNRSQCVLFQGAAGNIADQALPESICVMLENSAGMSSGNITSGFAVKTITPTQLSAAVSTTNKVLLQQADAAYAQTYITSRETAFAASLSTATPAPTATIDQAAQQQQSVLQLLR